MGHIGEHDFSVELRTIVTEFATIFPWDNDALYFAKRKGHISTDSPFALHIEILVLVVEKAVVEELQVADA